MSRRIRHIVHQWEQEQSISTTSTSTTADKATTTITTTTITTPSPLLLEGVFGDVMRVVEEVVVKGEVKKDKEEEEEEVIDVERWVALGEMMGVEAQAIATSLCHDILKHHQHHHQEATPSLVVRVMEITEVPHYLVVDELSSQLASKPLCDGGGDNGGVVVVVEYIIASHDSQLITTLAARTTTTKRPPNLRLRYLLLKPLHHHQNGRRQQLLPHDDLDDMAMDAIIVNDWVRTGSKAWWSGGGGGEREVEVEGMMRGLMDSLVGLHLVEGGKVVVRGFAPRPLWPSWLSLLLSSQNEEEEEDSVVTSSQEDIEGGLETTRRVLDVYGEVEVVERGGVKMLVCCPKGLVMTSSHPKPSPRLVVVVSDTRERGSVLKAAINAVRPHVVVEVMCLGPADVNKEEEEVVVSSEMMEKSLTDILHHSGRSSILLEGIVFLGGLSDTSVVGEVAFHRLVKLSQALNRLCPLIQDLHHDHDDDGGNSSGGGSSSSSSSSGPTTPVDVWVVTEGVYVGKIRPQQSVLQGLISALSEELDNTTYTLRHADMSDAVADMVRLASLVGGERRKAIEKTYAIDEGGNVVVPRYHPVDKESRLSEVMMPTDSHRRFVADVDPKKDGGLSSSSSSGGSGGGIALRFIVEEMDDPQDDEVQIDVHAVGVNFRDVMVSSSLLPEK